MNFNQRRINEMQNKLDAFHGQWMQGARDAGTATDDKIEMLEAVTAVQQALDKLYAVVS